jgi:hypothetical protein
MGLVTGEGVISAIGVDSTAVVGSVVADFPETEVESKTILQLAKTELKEGDTEEVLVDLIEAMKVVLEVGVGDFPDQKEVMMAALEVVFEVDVEVLIEDAVVSVVVGVLAAEVPRGLAFKPTLRELV